MKQVIVSIEPEPDLKLTLDNGDIIDKSDLIKKIDDINCGLMPLNDYLINFEVIYALIIIFLDISIFR